MSTIVVRTPASSANLGPGFDVLGMALTLYADCGLGTAPDGAQQLDERHPARVAYTELGGRGPIWMRSNIPMARGLGFSGAARVGGAALAAAERAGGTDAAIAGVADEILAATTAQEGHGDNVAASLHGGITAYIEGRALPIAVGPVVQAAAFVAWIPDVTTSTDASRRSLASTVDRADAIHNIARSIQFVTAIAQDNPTLLRGATADRLHQAVRLAALPGAAEAIESGVMAGAWCGWLSGSGPTVGLLCATADVADVTGALPAGGHAKVLAIDTLGARVTSA